MGRKVNPIGFRIGTTRTWSAKWHADKAFKQYLQEDLKLRQLVSSKYGDAAISSVDIERGAEDKITITLHTARPGMVIGRGGSRVEEIRKTLNDVVGENKKLQLNIKEISRPELDAFLVARSIAEQIERRVAYRRAMKQAIFRTLQSGALGIKIAAAGRLGGVEIARKQVLHQGRVPLHTLRADVDYGVTRAHTAMGDIGIKVWVYRGDILPDMKKEPPVVSENVKNEASPLAKSSKKTAPRKKPVAIEVSDVTTEEQTKDIVAEPLKETKARAKAAKTSESLVKSPKAVKVATEKASAIKATENEKAIGEEVSVKTTRRKKTAVEKVEISQPKQSVEVAAAEKTSKVKKSTKIVEAAETPAVKPKTRKSKADKQE